MSLTLEQALEKVDLEPGKLYQCRVNGRTILVHVLETDKRLLPSPLNEADIMYDPWADFPLSGAGVRVQAKPGRLLLPDPPIMPLDEEE